MPNFLSPGQRALLQQLLQMRQHELDRRVALRSGGAGRSEQAREMLQQDGDDAPQRDADRELDLALSDTEAVELAAIAQAQPRLLIRHYGRCALPRP